MSAVTASLLKLVHSYGIQTAYYGPNRVRINAEAESLINVLNALGAPVFSLSDVPDALTLRGQELVRKIIEPVIVAWDGILDSVSVNLSSDSTTAFDFSISLEDGSLLKLGRGSIKARIISEVSSGKQRFYSVAVQINQRLPFGYHHFILETDGKKYDSLIISAPLHGYLPHNYAGKWGVFIPLYALHSPLSWGAGDYSELCRLAEWTGKMQGSAVGTLPLLPAFLDRPFEPSPYLPASKLFLNEFYVDVTAAPGYYSDADVQRKVCTSAFRNGLSRQINADLVDYKAVMKLKRQVLEILARDFFNSTSHGNDSLSSFITSNPSVQQYAKFRAAVEQQAVPWHQWQSRLQKGDFRAGDFKSETEHYYLFTQWLAACQMQDAVDTASRSGVRLYLDFPVGTHPDGFDTWRYRNDFVHRLKAGAPPDRVFTRGQDWTFPPLHPDNIRQSGYEYFIAAIRAQMKYAGILRIDHVMGLHRIYVIPEKVEANQGAYLRYHPEEMYAILNLESHRNKCVVVGEDLGIVPKEVQRSIVRRGLQKMYVGYYEMAEGTSQFLRKPGKNTVASLATHDMPPFTAFWQGTDIENKLRAGIINKKAARQEKHHRKILKIGLTEFLLRGKFIKEDNGDREILLGYLRFLAQSKSRLTLINLEDLWQETHLHNLPSTTREHPNWRFKSRYSFETFCKMPEVLSILKEINRDRRGL